MHVSSGALYAVIEGRPIIWQVVRFTDGGHPQMVPLGRFVKGEDGGGVYRPIPVAGGWLWTPEPTDEVIYAPDHFSLMDVIGPWVEAERADG